jgi:hypothetical protein
MRAKLQAKTYGLGSSPSPKGLKIAMHASGEKKIMKI